MTHAAHEMQSNMIFCSTCSEKIAAIAVSCPKCGAPNAATMAKRSEKSFIATLLLCFFLGAFGVHRFYVGKVGTGILQLLTLGGLGVWALIDFIVIAVGSFKDSNGLKITHG